MIYTNKTFQGYWPIGNTAAIVQADSPTAAAVILNEALRQAGLPPTAQEKDMIEFPHPDESVRILADGNY